MLNKCCNVTFHRFQNCQNSEYASSFVKKIIIIEVFKNHEFRTALNRWYFSNNPALPTRQVVVSGSAGRRAYLVTRGIADIPVNERFHREKLHDARYSRVSSLVINFFKFVDHRNYNMGMRQIYMRGAATGPASCAPSFSPVLYRVVH